MKKSKSSRKPKKAKNIFAPSTDIDALALSEPRVHIYGKNKQVCLTDSRGYPTPQNRSPAEIVLDSSEGFIPLWAENVHLRWRFSPDIMSYFQYPDAAMQEIRRLLSEALLLWGDAAPVSFCENNDSWDFEIVMRPDNCNVSGCTLASAFFPDSGRHRLTIHPKLFSQSEKEQIETLVHEFGHIFGLRHFFANITETRWSSVIYGEHKPFSIMNYGNDSKLTASDKSDLKSLYQKVWSGELTKINGTPIVTFIPYHQL